MSIDLFQSPERLLFGWGSVGKTGEEALRYGAKALLVSGKTSSRASGALEAVCASLKSAGIAVTLFAKWNPTPAYIPSLLAQLLPETAAPMSSLLWVAAARWTPPKPSA